MNNCLNDIDNILNDFTEYDPGIERCVLVKRAVLNAASPYKQLLNDYNF